MRPLTAVAVILAVGLGAYAGSNPQVKQLQAEIKVLRAQKTRVIKALHAQYHAILHQGNLNDEQRSAARTLLGQQKHDLLSITSSKTQRDEIRANYHILDNALANGTAVTNTILTQVRAQEHGNVALVERVYNAQIKALQAQIKVLNKASHGSTRRR